MKATETRRESPLAGGGPLFPDDRRRRLPAPLPGTAIGIAGVKSLPAIW